MRTWKRVSFAVAVVLGLAVGLGADEAEAAKRASKKEVTGVINLNQASPQQLDLLPGVGEKAAKRIVEHRVKTPFGRPEELVRVKGFGKKKYERLKAYLRVSGATTLAEVKGGASSDATSSFTPAASTMAPQAQGRPSPKH